MGKCCCDDTEVLLKYDADVNAKSIDGWTPLHFAAQKNAVRNSAAAGVAKVLLKQRPDIKIDEKNNRGETPLYCAARDNEVEMVELLLKHGADVNAKQNSGLTPLRVAMRNNAVEAADLLRSYGGHE